MVGQKDELLFAVMGTAAAQRMGDFEVQGLANTAWAFATANTLKASQQDSQLFAELAWVAELCLGNLEVQDLVNTA